MAEKNRRKKSSSSNRKSQYKSTTIRSEINSSENISRRQQTRKRNQARYDRRQRIMVVGILIIVLILACIIGFATRKNGSEVLVNGTSVGAVDTRKVTQDDIIASVTAMIAEQVGTNVQIMDEIEVNGIHISSKTEVLSTESMLALLRDTVAYNIEAYAIAVDGEVVATLQNEAEAKEVLSYLNELYTPEDAENVSISYVEDVQIVSQYINADDVMDVETAKNKVAIGESSTKVHTISSGETLSSIVSAYGMSLNELLELNPSISSTSKIYVGEEVTVESSEPIITVKATVTITETETAEKEVEYQYDSTKSSSYKKIVQQGTAGVTEVTKEQVYINGVFDSESTVSTTVVTQPVTEIVTIGTN